MPACLDALFPSLFAYLRRLVCLALRMDRQTAPSPCFHHKGVKAHHLDSLISIFHEYLLSLGLYHPRYRNS